MSKGYYISKNNKHKDIIYLDYDQIDGYNIRPKNSNKYGISVNKMIIVKPSMIEKILIRKAKSKLNYFLKQIYALLESDDTDGDTLREALNDMTRYKNIINYKYNKFLNEKEIERINKRISLLEQELKRKQMYSDNHQKIRNNMYQVLYNNMYNTNTYEEEKTTHRSR